MAKLTRKEEDKRRFRIQSGVAEVLTLCLADGFTERELKEYIMSGDGSHEIAAAKRHFGLGVLPTPASMGYLYDTLPGKIKDAKIKSLAKPLESD
jgi:hypothetical protein